MIGGYWWLASEALFGRDCVCGGAPGQSAPAYLPHRSGGQIGGLRSVQRAPANKEGSVSSGVGFLGRAKRARNYDYHYMRAAAAGTSARASASACTNTAALLVEHLIHELPPMAADSARQGKRRALAATRCSTGAARRIICIMSWRRKRLRRPNKQLGASESIRGRH